MVKAGLYRVRACVAGGVIAVLGGCGGGGGGGSAPISVSFAITDDSLAEGDGPTNVVVVLHTIHPALTADLTVEVADAGTGSATTAVDYAAFAPQTITFLAGAIEGDAQTVTLDPLDDDLVDGPETVRLRLQNVVGGAVVSGDFTATLEDEDVATVDFATSVSSVPNESSGAQAVALELDCDPGVTLAVDVSVRVSDLHTGSASAPGDYSTFAGQTVTFSAGDSDGAIRTVSIQVVDDALTEGDETIELGLSAPSVACVLGTIQTHVLTIEDDEVGGNAAFLASEGATGTGNALAYDEEIALGTQAVGAGPNAGTLVRIANAGGQAMELGAPSLLGANDEDFAIEIESSSLTGAGLPSALRAAPGPMPLLALADDGGPGLPLRIVPSEVARLSELREVVLQGVALPELGPVTLELRQRPLPLSPDAKLVIDGRAIEGGPRTLLGGLQLWSGRVAELPDSRVFLALSERGARGFLELPSTEQRRVHVVSDAQGQVRLVSEPELAAFGGAPATDLCAGERFVPGVPGIQALNEPPATGALTMADCRLALETDFQLYDKFDSSVLLTNYVTELIGAVSDQYVTDVQTTLSIAYLGIHTTSNDGWDTQEDPTAEPFDLLTEFQTRWGTNWPAQADLAHFLSGDNLGGGVAYVNVLCNQSGGFAVSGSLSGTINWATWTGQAASFTWDFVVVAHEIGHNFGSSHTHSYCPPLDRCYTNCDPTPPGTVCTRGTLMSYCHLCAGMSNIDLFFHPVCANIMRDRVNASCLDDALLSAGDFVQYRLRFNPLTTTGARTASLEFAHDAPNATQPFRVQLSGTAN